MRFPVEILPIIVTIFSIGGFLITYGISVGLNHTIPVVPFISSTGETPPENGLFTIIFSCTAFQLLLIISIKFKQIWDTTEKKGCCNIAILVFNIIAYCLGLISSVGMLIVGSYTAFDSGITHTVGADLAILGGILYFILLTIISPFAEPKIIIRWVVLCIRIGLILFVLVMLGLYLVPSGDGQNSTLSTENGPFTFISPVAQWIILSVIFALILTLIPEFHMLDVRVSVLVKGRAEKY